MKPSFRSTHLLAAALIALGSNAASAATLADFEAPGSLTSWVTWGDVSLQHGNAALPDAAEGVALLALTTASTEYEDDYPATAGAFNLSGTAALDASAANGLATSLGLGPNGLDSGAAFAFEGSAASISFSASAGSTLSLRWNLLSTDTLFDDTAFVLLDGQRIDLATALQATQAVGGAYAAGGQTGWQTTTITLSHGGTVQLSFGIVDHDDAAGTSALLVDDVSVTPAIPEPKAWMLMSAGLALMGAAAARRRDRR